MKNTSSKELAFETHEQRIHSSLQIPYSLYDCKIPSFYPYVPIHWHKEYEIDFVTEGEGEFICGDEHFIAHPGDVILSLPNMLHAAYPTESNYLEYNAFVFSQNLLGRALNDRSYNDCIRPFSLGTCIPNLFYSSNHPDIELIKNSVSQIITFAKENNSHSDLILRGKILTLFWYLCKEDNMKLNSASSSDHTELIKPAIDYMTNHYDEALTIQKLSDMCSISSSHFMGTFKRVVGLSTIEYLNHLRIRSACSMLSESDDDIAAIAQNCGFSNISNFNRQFKKTVGCSPREYRHRK